MTAVLRLLRNVSSNYLYAVVNGLVLVVLTPIVVRTLGVEMYAVWVIVQTLAYYLGFLDLGVVDAQVQRHAVLASQKRFDEIGRLHGTVLCFFLAAGMVGLLIAIAVAALPSAQLFDVPAAAREAYGTALVLASVAMLLSFAGSAFNGIYEGFQRYDLMNAVNIVVSIVEAVSIYAVLAAGAGIVALAIVKIGAEALRAVLKLATAWRVFPSYALPRLRFDRSSWRAIRGFSFWNSLNDIVTEGTAHFDKLLIPILLGSALLTPYSLVLMIAAAVFIVAEPITDTYLPIAANRHARGDATGIGALLTRGTKLVNMATLPVLVVVLCFGQELLELWVGEAYTRVAPAVLWLTVINCYVSTYFWTALSVLMGAGLVKRMFWASLLELAIVLVLIMILVPPFGLTGLALGGLIGNVVIGFKYFIAKACRLGDLRLGSFLFATMLRPAAGAAPALAVGIGLELFAAPQSWLGVLLACAITGLVCFGGVAAVSSSRWERARWYATAHRLIQPLRAGAA